MKIWVTGAGGFMGPYLTDFLFSKGYSILASYYPSKEKDKLLNPKIQYIECDVRNRDKVYSILKEFKPDRIFHLAAQSLPTLSWKNPWYTIETNVIGTINIFEGIKELQLNSKILVACSSAEYGFLSENEVPVKESHALKPMHPYGVSKVSQENLTYQYFRNFGIKGIPVRIFNTTGPGKENDVCSDLTKRIVEIEKGMNKRKILRVGNLSTKRAITDVRDIIRAFEISLECATIGEVYNLSGDKVYSINEIIELLKNNTNIEFELFKDASLLRPSDEPIIYGDSSKFRNETGWKQEISLEVTLNDMFKFWREKL
jgi:GDP-4-dehydro-6-deoxy-D-mannose reductase